MLYLFFFFFFKQKTAYEMLRSLVGSEMCIRDRSRVVEGGGCTFVPYVPPMQITANSSSTAVNEGSRLLPDGAELSQMFFALFGSTEGADSLFEDMEGRGLLDLLPIDFD
eukprot:TRINITY_DN2572_c0_g1_i1.p3 TRINITY_DN2572_c0_g1~~TRINITY_DN2572_c0_g1_i1.p3  ORF type:complete len:110 (+),score=34.46 TRINITY_DN2572_c0_g1_i1:61-390(+)